MIAGFWRIRQTIGPRRTAHPLVLGEFSTESSLAGTLSAADRKTSTDIAPLDPTEPSSRQARLEKVPRSWIVALAALLLVYLLSCAVPRLFDQIDGQYAGAAREMMARGDWLVPTQNGVPRLQKPPLVYWCEALSMSTFGVNEFGARLPVALATLGWFLATALLTRRVVGTWSAGIASALTLAMFTGTFFFAHLVMPEPFLGCFLVLTFWSLLEAAQREGTSGQNENAGRWLMAAWTFIALGTFAKGIHAFLIPVTAVTCTAWMRPSLRPLWRKFLFRPCGWILVLTVLLPWYLAVEARYPGFLRDHFFNEQIGSALSRRWPPDSDRVPLWIFWPEHLVLLFPISLLFPAAFRAALQRWKDRRPWISDNGILILAWFLVGGLGISFANVQDYYLMIAWAPIAVWIAWAVTKKGISFKWPAVTIALLGASGLVAALVLAVWQGYARGDSSGANLLIGDTILNVFQILPSTVCKEMIPLFGIGSTFVLAAGILVLRFEQKGRSELCLAGFGLLMAAIFLIGTRGMQLAEVELSSAKVAEVIDSRSRSQNVVIVQGDPNEKTTLFFYLHRPIFWVDGHPDIEFATRLLGIGRDHYLTREQVAKAWSETTQVFLVIEGSALAEWKSFLGLNYEKSKPVGVCGSCVILVNR